VTVSDSSREQRLRALEERLGHRFNDLSLLDRALTHTSRANESLSSAVRHNEPLEFLGDAVLGFIVSDLLHRREPEGDEGTKSKTRALLVSEPSLARRAEALGIPALLQLGRGEEKSGGRLKVTLWADAYEAVVAALYLDGGLAAALAFVSAEFAEDIEAGAGLPPQDAKSALQEVLQARGADVPEYRVLAEEGPSHRRHFRVACVVEGRVVAEGQGHSKKEAQQDAARRALVTMTPSS
jgi:ribonuclease-3